MFEDECRLRAAFHGGTRGRPITQLPLPLVLCACRNRVDEGRGGDVRGRCEGRGDVRRGGDVKVGEGRGEER